MIEIPLTKGYVAIVDDEDADLAEMKWCALVYKNGTVYAVRRGKKTEQKSHYALHRVIGERIEQRDLTRKDDVDHWNGDGLNNTRKNLRVCTRSQNQGNRKKPINNTSGYKGVTRNSNARSHTVNQWAAQICVNGKVKKIGLFPTPEAAHEAYVEAAKKYFGEFARAA